MVLSRISGVLDQRDEGNLPALWQNLSRGGVMMKLTRRAFFTGLAALPFVGPLFHVTPAQAAPEVIVLKGGSSPFVHDLIDRGVLWSWQADPEPFTWYEDEWLPPKIS